MAKEPDQTRWVGIRPTDPAENIPVTESSPLTSIEVEPTPGSADFPVTESAPLTSIKVSPLLAGTTFKTETQKRTPAVCDLQAPESFVRRSDLQMNVGAPNYDQDVYTVAAGKVFKIELLSAYCFQATPTLINFVLVSGVTEYSFYYTSYGGAFEKHLWSIPIIFNENEKVRVKWTTTLAATNVFAAIFGHVFDKY